MTAYREEKRDTLLLELGIEVFPLDTRLDDYVPVCLCPVDVAIVVVKIGTPLS